MNRSQAGGGLADVAGRLAILHRHVGELGNVGVGAGAMHDDHWPKLTGPKVAAHPGDLRVVGRFDQINRAMVSQPVFDREEQAEHGRRLAQVNGEGLAHRLDQVGEASLGGERVGERVAAERRAVLDWFARRWGALSARIVNRTADLLIAFTALDHVMTLVTRNVRQFGPTGVPVLNPYDG